MRGSRLPNNCIRVPQGNAAGCEGVPIIFSALLTDLWWIRDGDELNGRGIGRASQRPPCFSMVLA